MRSPTNGGLFFVRVIGGSDGHFKIDSVRGSVYFGPMKESTRFSGWVDCLRAVTLIAVLALGGLVPTVAAQDPVTYALCDVRVVYLFDEADRIDWPTLYYLNDFHGCRIDLVKLQSAAEHRITSQVLADRNIAFHHCHLVDGDSLAIDKLAAKLWDYHPPDLVLVSRAFEDGWHRQLIDYLMAPPADSTTLFSTAKVYELMPEGTARGNVAQVVLNPQELFVRYHDRLQLETPLLVNKAARAEDYGGFQVRYAKRFDRSGSGDPESDFLSGIGAMRLPSLIEQVISEGPMRQTYLNQARHFMSCFHSARSAVGPKRADQIIDGFRQLRFLTEPPRSGQSDPRIGNLQRYLKDLSSRAEQAALATVGIAWDGRIVVPDTPHGSKVKFRLSLSANGPSEVVLESVMFRPHWDSVEVVLDSLHRIVSPHQSFVREFLVDIDPQYLETQQPESLTFVVALSYGAIPLRFERSLPLRQTPKLMVSFDPDYHIVPPVGNIDVDRVVGSTSLDVIITKARDFAGQASLELATPRGVFAGAYRQTLDLSQSQTLRRVRIPFTISNLMEMGPQMCTVALSVDNQQVAVDTAFLRIARCQVADTLTIGFIPDSSGQLEDALRMTNADFRPLTDRSLLRADLSAYSVIIIGSNGHRRCPSLKLMYDRFEEYIRYGGSLVILGQDYDWPQGILPFSLVPLRQTITREQIVTQLPDARVLSRPDKISVEDLLRALSGQVQMSGANVSLGEVVFETTGGVVLLSVSRLGEGQMIYCGLPLLDMVAQLNLEAIHLLANILNY